MNHFSKAMVNIVFEVDFNKNYFKKLFIFRSPIIPLKESTYFGNTLFISGVLTTIVDEVLSLTVS